MRFDAYINRRVRIILNNKFTYVGLVVDFDDNSITLIDKTNSRVCLKEIAIECIEGVDG